MYYLISTAGHPNVGDELITRTWLRELARRDPDAEVWLDCPQPAGAQALFAAEHPRLRCVDTIFRLCAEAPSDQAWDVAAFVQAALDDPGLAPRWLPGLRLFCQASSVHLLGGGYVNSMWERHVGLLAALDWAARRGARTAVTGQGLAPLDSDTVPLTRHLLDRVDVVEVRDTVSAALLDRPDAFGGDDLWMADLDTLVDEERAAELDAVICVQGDLLEVSGEWLTARALQWAREGGADPARTAVIECIPRVDRLVYDRLRTLLPGLQFVPWIEVLDRGFPAGAHQRWFSSRFHPHMVAARAGARGVAVPVRPGYYDVKHASLLEVGTGWELIDQAERPPRRRWAAPVDFAANVRDLRARKDRTAEFLYGAALSAARTQAPAVRFAPSPRVPDQGADLTHVGADRR